MKAIRNSSGFSLLELALTSAISMIVLGGIMSMVANQTQQMKGATADAAYNAFAARVRQATFSEDTLTATRFYSPDLNFKACMGTAPGNPNCITAATRTSLALYDYQGNQVTGTLAAPIRFGRDGSVCVGCAAATVAFPYRAYSYYYASCDGKTWAVAGACAVTVNDPTAVGVNISYTGAQAIKLIYYLDQDPAITASMEKTARMEQLCNDPLAPPTGACNELPVVLKLPVVPKTPPAAFVAISPTYKNGQGFNYLLNGAASLGSAPRIAIAGGYNYGPSSLNAAPNGIAPSTGSCKAGAPPFGNWGTMFTLADGGVGVCSQRAGVTSVYQIGGTSSAAAADSTNFGVAATPAGAFAQGVLNAPIAIAQVLPTLPGMYVCPISTVQNGVCNMPWGLSVVSGHFDPNPGCDGQIQGKPFCWSGCDALGNPIFTNCTPLY